MKKFILLGVILGVILLSFNACNNSSSQSGTNTNNADYKIIIPHLDTVIYTNHCHFYSRSSEIKFTTKNGTRIRTSNYAVIFLY